MNKTVISLVEQPHLEWKGRIAYLSAKLEERKTELYIGDLVYLLVKSKYDVGSAPCPTDYEFKQVRRDTRSTEQIKNSILQKLKGA